VEKARENDGWNDKVACALMLLEPTQRHFPQYIEEISGYAEAAHIHMRELWALCVEDDAHNKCTTVVTNGGKLLLHNDDWDPEAANAVCVLEKTVGELTILELYYYVIPLGGSAV